MADEVEVKAENIAAKRPVEKFAEYAMDRAEMEAPLVAQELGTAQGEAILTASTEEELEAAMEMAGLVGLRDFEDGTEIEIRGYHLAPGTRSDFRNRFGVFAVMDCVIIETGREVAIDTGIERVIMWLRAREVMSGFPVQRRVSKVQTGSGNDMITLLPLKKRPVKS